MSRIAIFPYGPSDSVNALKESLVAGGISRVVKLRREGSTFRGRRGDVVINWGNSNVNVLDVVGNATILNTPSAIRLASMKTEAFAAFAASGVNTVEWTTDRAVAQGWVDTDALVYARTQLQGHSGEGIVMVHRRPETVDGVGDSFQVQDTLPNARLYTKGIRVQRREFRIHVMQGHVTYVQQKKRAEGWRELSSYSNTVRNYHTGWIYATSDVRPNQAALDSAIAAIQALGLDFGAVDVITRHEDAWVLEVNTAPGLQGTNLETYTNNFIRISRGEAPEVWSVRGNMMEEGATQVSIDPVSDLQQAVRFHEWVVPDMAVGHGRGASAVNLTAALREAGLLEVAPPPAPAPVEPVAPVRPAPTRVVSTSDGTPRDGAFYRATINGVNTIVQYNADVGGFYMPGWEIPMEIGDNGFVVVVTQEVI